MVFFYKKINEENITIIDFTDDNEIEKNITKKNIDYIVPLSKIDYNIIKNKICNNIKILYPKTKLTELLHNKLLFTQFMMNNFSEFIPKVYYLDDILINTIEFPVISKPIYSTNGCNMIIYHNKNEFIKCTTKTIIQKYISYEYEYSCHMLCIDGKIINYKVIKQKYPKYTIKRFNFSSDYENVEIFDIKIFENIIKILNYSGGSCIDFKYDEINKKIFIFEINPRFGGSAFSNNFIYDLLCVK